MDAHPRCGIAGSRIYNYDGTIQESCGEFDTWTGAFLRSSAWGEWPMLRALRQRLRTARLALRQRTPGGYRHRRGAGDPAFAVRGDRRLRRAFLSLPRRSRLRQARGRRRLGDVVRTVERGRARGHGQRARTVQRRDAQAASRRKYWIKHHGRGWYGLLVAALTGRYLLYAGAAAAIALARAEVVAARDRARSGRHVRPARRLPGRRSLGRARRRGEPAAEPAARAAVSRSARSSGSRRIEVLDRGRARARRVHRGAAAERADALGANGVVGLQFDSRRAPTARSRCVAFGEAVVLEPERAARALSIAERAPRASARSMLRGRRRSGAASARSARRARNSVYGEGDPARR